MKCPNCGASTKRGICEYCGHDQLAYQRELQSLNNRTNFERNADKIVETANTTFQDTGSTKKIISIILAVLAIGVIIAIISLAASGVFGNKGSEEFGDQNDEGRVVSFTFTHEEIMGGTSHSFNYSGVFENTGSSKISSVRINVVLKNGDGMIVDDTSCLLINIEASERKSFSGLMVYIGTISGNPAIEVLNFEF